MRATIIFSNTDDLLDSKNSRSDMIRGSTTTVESCAGGQSVKATTKGLESRFKVDKFAQANINYFCIMVDSSDGQVRVARGSG